MTMDDFGRRMVLCIVFAAIASTLVAMLIVFHRIAVDREQPLTCARSSAGELQTLAAVADVHHAAMQLDHGVCEQ